MEMKWAAWVAVSAVASVLFVGCSCASAVDNSTHNLDSIVMESDVSVSAVSSTTTQETTGESTASTTGTGTETSDATGTTTTTGTRAVQYVGRSEAQQQQVITAYPEVVTQIVVVTVTIPPTTTVTAAQNAPLVTVEAPDSAFHPEQDMQFAAQDVTLTLGEALPNLSGLVIQVSTEDGSHGGVSANIYTCDGFQVKTEVFAEEDGSTEEQVTEIVLSRDSVSTGKGVAVGADVSSIFAAYGRDACEELDGGIYRYQTEDGKMLEFLTNGVSVTEIRYTLAQ